MNSIVVSKLEFTHSLKKLFKSFLSYSYCLVTVSCKSNEMVARVRTSRKFNGKIYAKNKPNDCINDITNSLEFDIKMHYNRDECGVKQSSPGHFVNDIVIQHHDMVVTTRDLALGVYCKFDLYNDSISFLDLTIDG